MHGKKIVGLKMEPVAMHGHLNVEERAYKFVTSG